MFVNHVEISVRPGTMTADYVAALDTFLCETLGWSHMMHARTPTHRSYWIARDHFLTVFESAKHAPDNAPDHIGFRVESDRHLEDLLDRCKKLQERDSRATVRALVEGQPHRIHVGEDVYRGFAIGYLLPQGFEFHSVTPKTPSGSPPA